MTVFNLSHSYVLVQISDDRKNKLLWAESRVIELVNMKYINE